MVSVRKRGKKWVVDYREPDGTRIQRVVSTHKRRADAVAADIRSRLEREKWGLPVKSSKTLKEFLGEFTDWAKLEKSGRTADWYEQKIRKFLSFIRDKPLYKITASTIEEFKTKRLKAVSGQTVAGDLAALNVFFNLAVKRKHINENPCREVSRPRRLPQNPRRFLNENEIEALFEATKGTVFYPMVATALYAGLRRSELIWLEWKDIGRGTITVQSKVGWHTKSYRSRSIPLHPRLKEILEALPRKSRWCFPTKEGKQYLHNLGRNFQKVLKESGVKCNFHECRHTFASFLVMSGSSLAAVRELLGHSDIKTTMVYTHLSKDHLRGAVARLNFPG